MSEENKDINNEIKKDKKEKKSKEKELIEQLENNNKELNDKILRLSADIQNMSRRSDERIQQLLKYEGEDFVKEILMIVDNFERAISMDDDNLEDEVSKFLSGFKMIYTNLLSILSKAGVTQIECLNAKFDPNLMEAVMTESKEGMEANNVIEVLQKGYMYKDKCIRHAIVKVSA